MRVWRPLAKKSTANQRISYGWLILTVDTLLTVYEIFSGVEVENRHFRPLYSDCSPLAEERPAISVLSMHRWKVHLVGYNSVADSTGLSSIFIRFAVVAFQICEITRNSEKIRTYSSSRSSKVIDLCTNRKRICNLLLVINSNFGRISYRFRDIDA